LAELVANLPAEEDVGLEEWLIDEDALPEHVASRLFSALRQVNFAKRTAESVAVGAEELFGDLVSQGSAANFWALWLQDHRREGSSPKSVRSTGKESSLRRGSHRTKKRANSPTMSESSFASFTTDSSGCGIHIGSYEGPLRRGPLVVGILKNGFQPADIVPGSMPGQTRSASFQLSQGDILGTLDEQEAAWLLETVLESLPTRGRQSVSCTAHRSSSFGHRQRRVSG